MSDWKSVGYLAWSKSKKSFIIKINNVLFVCSAQEFEQVFNGKAPFCRIYVHEGRDEEPETVPARIAEK